MLGSTQTRLVSWDIKYTNIDAAIYTFSVRGDSIGHTISSVSISISQHVSFADAGNTAFSLANDK